MTKNYDVKEMTEATVEDFLTKFYGVDSLSELTVQDKNGYVLNHFNYMNHFVFAPAPESKSHHLMIFIDKAEHKIFAIIDYWDATNDPTSQKMSFVDLNDTYSDDEMEEMLPEIFDEFAKRLRVKNFHDCYQSVHDKKVKMQDSLINAMEANDILLFIE